MAENNNRNMRNFEMLEIKQIVTADGKMNKNNKDEEFKFLSYISTDHGEHNGDVAARAQREAVAAGARHQSRYFDEFRYKRFL